MKYLMHIALLALFLTQAWEAAGQKWEKSGTRMWKGRDHIFYRLDETCRLLSSPDGDHWIVSADSTWESQDGQWYKISEGTLLTSADGASWKPSADGKWNSFDGNTFRLEDNCSLMVIRQADMGKAEPPTEKEAQK